MLAPRLIPVLLVDSKFRLVKTINFAQRHYLGDPFNASYVFSAFEVDELLVLDIDATPQGRSISLRFVESLARFTRVPLCVGGGISSLQQIQDLLALGVERVALSAALQSNFCFLQQATERFGSSSISVVINVLERSDSGDSDLGPPTAFLGRHDAGHSGHALLDLALLCQQAGAGELILNFIKRDGTRCGYAVEQLAAVNRQFTIPLVGLGGCGSHFHIAELLAASPLSGVAAGCLFVYAPDSREVLLNYPLTHQHCR